MSQPRQIHVLVVSHLQDDAERVSQLLRSDGLAARCEWASTAEQFSHQLTDETNLVISRQDTQSPSGGDIVAIAAKHESKPPVVWIDESVDEQRITNAIADGAADLVTLNSNGRFTHTLKRELRLCDLERRMSHSRNDAATYQKQFSSILDNVPDAIAHVQEGIIVEVNKAWQELFGYKTEDDCVALPLMDAVSKNSQDALKGALKAISRDKWPGEPLIVSALKADEESFDVPLLLEAAHFDGEPAVRIAIKPAEKEDKRVSSLMRDATTKDQSTFLYHRKHFLKLLKHRLESPLETGQRLFAWMRIDNFKEVRQELGVLRSEEVIADFAELLRQRTDRADIAGRFEGTAFTVLLERGTAQDAVNWANAFAHAVSEHTFRAGERTINLTCSIGLCPNDELVKSIEELITVSEATYREARSRGTTQVRLRETSDEDTRIRNHDAIWSKRLTEALKENRFRLLQQPIAALDGESGSVFDILVRLIDEHDEPIAPSEFLPAARRTKMLHAIDRWVIGASMALCRERRPDLLFVRLSEQSLTDKSFGPWLKSMIGKAQIKPSSLCFQVSEEVTLKYLNATAQLANFVRTIGCQFALEHCGTTDKSSKLIESLPLNFVKIDGSLIASLATDESARTQAGALVDAAKHKNIETIAEKVQDANTMAALWQLGISFMQGHYVQEPEVILQESA
ncbi:MAG: EAL domain-containing protein [Woeseiaceae bacterium]